MEPGGEAGLLKQVAPLAVLLLTVAYLNWIVIPVEEAPAGRVRLGVRSVSRERAPVAVSSTLT